MQGKQDSKPTVELDEEIISAPTSLEKQQQITLERDDAAEHALTFRYVLKYHPSLIFYSIFWGICTFGWGFDLQINVVMISVPAFRRDFGYIFNGVPVLPADWQTGFNVMGTLTGIIGAALCSVIADRWGRKTSLLVGIIISSGGIFGEVFSVTRVQFLMSKMFIGLGVGIYLAIAPVGISEITPVVMRGLSTVGINLGIAMGQLVSNGVLKGFGARMDRWAYRGPFAIQFVFTVFLLAFYPFVPETPWYLVRKGKLVEAEKSVQRLWGGNVDAANKVAVIQAVIAEEEKSPKPTVLDCFRGTNFIRSFISMWAVWVNYWTGIIFVLGYSTYFFQLAGLSLDESFDMGVGVAGCALAGNILSWFVVNSFGRRRTLNIGLAVLMVIQFIIGTLDFVTTGAAKWGQASLIIIFAFIYFGTVGAMGYVLIGEVSSPSLRAPTAALAAAMQAILGTVMNTALPYMVNPDEANLGGKVGFFFGGLSFLSLIGCWVWIPELKGRTFHEIDYMFQHRVPPRKMGKYQIHG
ncbi:hypothetical protein ABW19_dt0206407 [Dactylella cylindrospora]|nr:hypothetical protein ABW19_dt0206407 [Dactylella cylindrospora]